MVHQQQVFLRGGDTRRFTIDVVKTSWRPGKSTSKIDWGSGPPSKQTIFSRWRTSVLEYVLQKTQFAKYLGKNSTSSGHVGWRRSHEWNKVPGVFSLGLFCTARKHSLWHYIWQINVPLYKLHRKRSLSYRRRVVTRLVGLIWKPWTRCLKVLVVINLVVKDVLWVTFKSVI